MSRARKFLTLVTTSFLGGGVAIAADMKDAIFTDYGRALVGKPPAALGLDPFYEKYVDAGGIPITTSAKVPDVALLVARDVISEMLEGRPDLRERLVADHQRVGVMAIDEMTTD